MIYVKTCQHNLCFALLAGLDTIFAVQVCVCRQLSLCSILSVDCCICCKLKCCERDFWESLTGLKLGVTFYEYRIRLKSLLSAGVQWGCKGPGLYNISYSQTVQWISSTTPTRTSTGDEEGLDPLTSICWNFIGNYFFFLANHFYRIYSAAKCMHFKNMNL